MGDEHSVRLGRVEDDVGGIKNHITKLETQMRGFGDILERIEQGVAAAQQRFDDDKQASRVNPIALTTVLISIISILVGGSWLVSGNLSRLDERSVWQQHTLERVDERMWQQHGGKIGPATTAAAVEP